MVVGRYVLATLCGTLATATWPTICNEPLDRVESVSATMGEAPCVHDTGSIEGSDQSFVSDFCFSDGTLTNNSFTVNATRPFLVQRLQLVPVVPGAIPDTVRVRASLGQSDEPVWFRNVTDRMKQAAWSVVPVKGDLVDISSSGLEFTSLTMYPETEVYRELDFKLRVLGCPLFATGHMQYKFLSSSQDAIQTQFGTVELFEKTLLNIVRDETKMDIARLHPHTVIDSEGTVNVDLLVLPDSNPASPSVDQLVSVLSSTKSLSDRLKALQTSLVDVTSQLCIKKQCPSGTFCVNGKCVNRSTGDLVGEASSVVSSDSQASIRRILATAPMIKSKGLAGALSYRELIFILIGGGTFLAVVSIGLFRVYRRMKNNDGTIE